MNNRITSSLFSEKHNRKDKQYVQEEQGNKQIEVIDEKGQSIREVSVIEASLRCMQRYHKRIRGERSETKQLNIHMKTLNEKYLKQCLVSKQLEEDDKKIYNKYKQINANFESSKFLFQSISPQLKSQYRSYAKSSNIVKDILLSDRMFINNKIIFIKFLKKVQSGIDTPNVSWKSLYFHKNRNSVMTENISQNNRMERQEEGDRDGVEGIDKINEQEKEIINIQNRNQEKETNKNMFKSLGENSQKISINNSTGSEKEDKEIQKNSEIKRFNFDNDYRLSLLQRSSRFK